MARLHDEETDIALELTVSEVHDYGYGPSDSYDVLLTCGGVPILNPQVLKRGGEYWGAIPPGVLRVDSVGDSLILPLERWAAERQGGVWESHEPDFNVGVHPYGALDDAIEHRAPGSFEASTFAGSELELWIGVNPYQFDSAGSYDIPVLMFRFWTGWAELARFAADLRAERATLAPWAAEPEASDRVVRMSGVATPPDAEA